MKKPGHIYPLLGPHEGRELELMLKGEKPAAMFYDIEPYTEGIIPEHEFQPHVNNGAFQKREVFFEKNNRKIRYVFYAPLSYTSNIERLIEITLSYTSNIERLIEIMKYSFDPKRTPPWPQELEREIGQLLGYSQEAIDYYSYIVKRDFLSISVA